MYFTPLRVTVTRDVRVCYLGAGLQAVTTRPTLGAAEVLISSVPDVNYARAIPQRHVHKAVQGDYTRLDKIGADRAQKIAWLARVLRGAGCSVVPNFTPA